MNINEITTLSHDYIRGLVEGEGCFSFCSIPNSKSSSGKVKLPAFMLQMADRDKNLIENVKYTLGLKNKVYVYKQPAMRTHKPDKIYKRKPMAMLIVRDFGQLKNIIIPFFYGKLIGYKGKQFIDWLEKIGSDPMVPEGYKLLYRLHVSGFYKK